MGEWGSGGVGEWGSGGVGERRSGGAEEWGSGGLRNGLASHPRGGEILPVIFALRKAKSKHTNKQTNKQTNQKLTLQKEYKCSHMFTEKVTNVHVTLKWYYDQKIHFLFSFRF